GIGEVAHGCRARNGRAILRGSPKGRRGRRAAAVLGTLLSGPVELKRVYLPGVDEAPYSDGARQRREREWRFVCVRSGERTGEDPWANHQQPGVAAATAGRSSRAATCCAAPALASVRWRWPVSCGTTACSAPPNRGPPPRPWPGGARPKA